MSVLRVVALVCFTTIFNPCPTAGFPHRRKQADLLVDVNVEGVGQRQLEIDPGSGGGGGGGGGCFPAASTAMLDDGSSITMDNLQPGQTVMTVSDNGVLMPTKVLTFLHKAENTVARFLRLNTESGHQLKLTANHLLYATTGNNTASAQMRMAADVHVGDYVFVSHKGRVEHSVIVDITDSQLTGFYIPLTEQGSLLVDGVLASCYASFDHDLAHTVMTPLRWFPRMFDVLPMTEDGQHSYAKLMKWLGRTVLPDWSLRIMSNEAQKAEIDFKDIGVIGTAGLVDKSFA